MGILYAVHMKAHAVLSEFTECCQTSAGVLSGLTQCCQSSRSVEPPEVGVVRVHRSINIYIYIYIYFLELEQYVVTSFTSPYCVSTHDGAHGVQTNQSRSVFATAQKPAFCSVCEAARDICPPLEVTFARIVVWEAFAAPILIKVRG